MSSRTSQLFKYSTIPSAYQRCPVWPDILNLSTGYETSRAFSSRWGFSVERRCTKLGFQGQAYTPTRHQSTTYVPRYSTLPPRYATFWKDQCPFSILKVIAISLYAKNNDHGPTSVMSLQVRTCKRNIIIRWRHQALCIAIAQKFNFKKIYSNVFIIYSQYLCLNNYNSLNINKD